MTRKKMNKMTTKKMMMTTRKEKTFVLLAAIRVSSKRS